MSHIHRNTCSLCKASWWWNQNSLVHPRDHQTPTGRACPEARVYFRGEEYDHRGAAAAYQRWAHALMTFEVYPVGQETRSVNKDTTTSTEE